MSHILRVFASLAEDVHNGWVFLPKNIIEKREVVKLKNIGSGKTVYCEALPIDNGFKRRYNNNERTKDLEEASVVLNGWYRRKLDINKTQQEIEFEIKVIEDANFLSKITSCWGKIGACLSHPQIVVRLATWLGIIGLALGILPMLIQLITIFF